MRAAALCEEMFAAEEAAAAEVAYFESRAEELRVEMQAGCARPWTRAEVAVEMAAAPAAVGADIIALRCFIPHRPLSARPSLPPPSKPLLRPLPTPPPPPAPAVALGTAGPEAGAR